MASVNVPQWRSHNFAKIVRWHVRDGDFVEADDQVVDLEYPDAVVTQIAGVEGIVAQTYNWIGNLPIGKPVATIDEYSMPGMPTPRLANYGLTQFDVVSQRKQKRVEDLLRIPGAGLGGVVGIAVLVAMIEPAPSDGLFVSWFLFGAAFGLIGAVAAGEPLAARILRRTNQRFEKWQKHRR